MAVETEADYTLSRGEAMATTETAANIPASTQPEHLSAGVPAAEADEMTPFERIVARMKGTAVIRGDIVNSDPEDWDCEGE